MRLSQSTEYVVLAGLIAYIALVQPLQVVREFLATPVGKALALGGIVYVWKFVSPVIAGLLLVAYVRCAGSGGVMEGMENAQKCKCPSGFVYDEATKKCRNPSGQTKAPEFCPCPSGFFWDVIASECKASSSETPTPVPVAGSAAPATSTGAVTSTAPMTTPSAVQDAIAQMNVAATPPPATGVQPSMSTQESFSPY